jgi:glycosyltransferase involved in cell wall biosynthesis
MNGVAIVIPMLNEAAGLPRLLRSLAALEPPPAEVLAVDGGSTDASVAIAEAAGLLVVRHETRGRAAAINRGVREATAPVICVLHADTLLPDDAVAVMRRVLADPGTALAGFTALLSGPDRVRWGPASTTGSRPGTRHCCSGRNSSCAACGCYSATTPCSSAEPISWPSAAATPRCWSWRRRICASASTGSAEPASSTVW